MSQDRNSENQFNDRGWNYTINLYNDYISDVNKMKTYIDHEEDGHIQGKMKVLTRKYCEKMISLIMEKSDIQRELRIEAREQNKPFDENLYNKKIMSIEV